MKLTQIGNKVAIAESPNEAKLECIDNQYNQHNYVIRLTVSEFTSLCPVTGQPDFANIIIDYIPKNLIIESKSFKLFMSSFRNHGAFHEECTMYIANRLCEAMQPIWLRIGGYWYPRGGIPIDIFYQTGQAPKGVWMPNQDIKVYSARST